MRTSRKITHELQACSRAVLAADQAFVNQALESVTWERRGWLGRLVRVERPPEQIERSRGRRDERLVA